MLHHPNVHKTERMFSWVVHKTKHRCLFCSAVFLWPVSQTCRVLGYWTSYDAGVTSEQQKEQKYAKRRNVLFQNLSLSRLKSKQQAWTHFHFLQYRAASSLELTWNSVATGIHSPQFTFLEQPSKSQQPKVCNIQSQFMLVAYFISVIS